MRIMREALAGTLESSDLMVRIAPRAEGLEIVLQSEVIHQFGIQIEKVVRETLARLDVVDALVVIEDKGALDCVIKARVQTAVLRATVAPGDALSPRRIADAPVDWSALS
ncbi:MAG: citrate lyase acyl carrier protein [Azospirillaceae bacterium]|nr:citrate lyase acyl carrier protein [Azospirillaceae bacterium]